MKPSLLLVHTWSLYSGILTDSSTYLKVSLEISRVGDDLLGSLDKGRFSQGDDLLRSLDKERCSQGVCFPGEEY